MSLEEKFNAAVNVIRSLPKSGEFLAQKMLIKIHTLAINYFF